MFRAAFLAIAGRARGRGQRRHEPDADGSRRIIAAAGPALRAAGLGNLWQVALKDSSLISVTGLTELMRVSQVGAGSTHRPFAFYLGGAVLYLAMTVVTTRVFDIAETRATRGMRRAAG